jgi:antitoxin component YwqK of YwqJK toxin-antitoxin module
MSQIKSITVYKKDYMQPGMLDNPEQNEGVISSFTAYDNAGKICEEVSYHPDGSIEHKSLFKHDERGNLIEELFIGLEGEIEEKRSYEYDAEGKRIKEFYYYLDESFDTIHYEYDNNGKLIAKETVNSDEEPENKEIFEYAGDLLIRDAVYDFEKKLLSENSYEYDEKGNITEHQKKDSIEGSYVRMAFEYDENGKRNLALVYNADNKLISKESFEEDENGRVVKLIDEDQYSMNTTEILYDENGNVFEQVETNRAGELNNKTVRIYDADNNLIEHNMLIDRHGYGPNQNYTLSYIYEFF